jgi:hypothetical protein
VKPGGFFSEYGDGRGQLPVREALLWKDGTKQLACWTWATLILASTLATAILSPYSELSARLACEMSSRVLVLLPQPGIDWERITERARQYHLEPVDMYELRGMLAAGRHYRSNLTEYCRQAAHYVHMILNGAAPAELPVAWTLSTLDLVIHNHYVKHSGLTVRSSLAGSRGSRDRVKRTLVTWEG